MQLKDDPDLLELMLAGQTDADPEFRPGNYWVINEGPMVRELRKHGLHDIRRRRSRVLMAFGAGDLAPETSGGSAIGRSVSRIRAAAQRRLRRGLHRIGIDTRDRGDWIPYYSMDLERIRSVAAELARRHAAEAGARPLSDLDITMAGNPDDVFEVDGTPVTMSILYYYMRYAYCCRHTDFDALNTVVELGSGSGKQVEVIKRLHPNVTYLIFDLIPQLYVAEQFLQAAFPGQVVSYRDTRGFTDLAQDVVPGKIHVLPTWQFPLLRGWSWDLFWNAASFQEMEPDLVRNYRVPVNDGAQAVYLQELFGGKPIARRKKGFGVEKPTLMADYEGALRDFTRTDLSTSWAPTGPVVEEGPYHDSWWERR